MDSGIVGQLNGRMQIRDEDEHFRKLHSKPEMFYFILQNSFLLSNFVQEGCIKFTEVRFRRIPVVLQCIVSGSVAVVENIDKSRSVPSRAVAMLTSVCDQQLNNESARFKCKYCN